MPIFLTFKYIQVFIFTFTSTLSFSSTIGVGSYLQSQNTYIDAAIGAPFLWKIDNMKRS